VLQIIKDKSAQNFVLSLIIRGKFHNAFLSEDQELHSINHILLTTVMFLRKKRYKKITTDFHAFVFI